MNRVLVTGGAGMIGGLQHFGVAEADGLRHCPDDLGGVR